MKIPDFVLSAGGHSRSRIVTRRKAMQGGLALAASSFLPGCGGSPASTGVPVGPTPTPPDGTQPAPTGSITDASLTVAATATGSIGADFAGLSYEKSTLYETPYLFTGTNANLIALFKLIGPSILRIGGNSVDRNVWTPAGAGQTEGQIAPNDVNALAAFLAATGWKCLYGVNLGGAGPNPYNGGSYTAATTTTLAADEIAYVYQALGSSLFGFEIGNECDLYGSSYFSGTTWNVSTFEALWAQYRAAIVAKTPAVAALCTGPADAGSESSWTLPLGQWATKSNISLLTQHYYRGNGQSSPPPTAADLLQADTSLVSDLSTLNTGATGIGIPFRLSECNSYYNGGAPGVSNAYCSSLWIIDFLFINAQGGSAGTNFHGGGEGAYTPIQDSGGAVVEVMPEYYGILFFRLAGQGTLDTTSFTGIGSLNVTAYAVKSSTGALNIIVVNKDSAANLQLTIQLPQSAPSASLLQLAQASSNINASTGITIQGASVATNGSFSPGTPYALSPSGSQVTCYVPFYSAVLIQIP